MPVFLENAGQERNSRVNSILAPPLPYLRESNTTQSAESVQESYDVVVAGAGPAGLMLSLLLSRYGIKDDRLLCLDAKDGSVKAGQADGLQPRTIEVFKSLGLADEIVNDACQMWEVAFWNPEANGIARTSIVPDIGAPARYAQEFTIHQGRIERILIDDFARYSNRGVQYNSEIQSVIVDDNTNPEYPVVVTFKQNSEDHSPASCKSIRAKHVVGCDGARSKVRSSVNLELKGDTRDHIWGVIDLVVDSDFPDIRRRCAIHSDAGSVMVIPRERIPTGDYLTRLYIQVNDGLDNEDGTSSSAAKERNHGEAALDAREQARQKRAKVTLDGLLQQAKAAFFPYKVAVKQGTEVDWWAAYQIGQRMADSFCVRDSFGLPRVFIAGDACHTHSPKAGQGMNVSMMDSYNLAWKLAYHLQGIAPDSTMILDSYETERREIAAELIAIDNQFSSMFSGKMSDVSEESANLTKEEFEGVFRKINGFTTGCGVEYQPNSLVWDDHSFGLITGDQYLDGILKPGRRLPNVQVLRHADSAPRNLQDDFPSIGRLGILVFTRPDLLTPTGVSAKSLDTIDAILKRYHPCLTQLSVLHSHDEEIRGIDWTDLPPSIKQRAEMRFHSARPGETPAGQNGMRKECALGAEDAYKIFGVERHKGAIVVVRPDGYVGSISALGDEERVARYLDAVLARQEEREA